MVVVSVLAVVSAIALPQVARNRQRANEDALRAQLALVRAAVGAFYADNGCFPGALADLTRSTVPATCRTEATANFVPAAARYGGPYLSWIDPDPVSRAALSYNVTSFTVGSSAAGNDSRGVPFSSY
jgi:type II secretory pathway pseudopilin PulG